MTALHIFMTPIRSASPGSTTASPWCWSRSRRCSACCVHRSSPISLRFATHTGGASSDRVRHLERVALPLLPFINEFAETLGVPRICVTADQWHGLLAAFATPNGDDAPQIPPAYSPNPYSRLPRRSGASTAKTFCGTRPRPSAPLRRRTSARTRRPSPPSSRISKTIRPSPKSSSDPAR